MGVKCSEVGHKCRYSCMSNGVYFCCDYLCMNGKRRGCDPEDCDKYEPKGRYRKYFGVERSSDERYM